MQDCLHFSFCNISYAYKVVIQSPQKGGDIVAFSIHDVKTVEERYDPGEVNGLLKKGWFLLSVGFDEGIEGTESLFRVYEKRKPTQIKSC